MVVKVDRTMDDGVSQAQWACQTLFLHSRDQDEQTNPRMHGRKRTLDSPNRELLLFHRDRRNLNASVVDQGRCLDCRAGRFGVRQHTFVNLVHVGELMNVSEVDGHTDHVLQFEASGLENSLDIVEGCGCFGADSPTHQFVGLVRTLLTGDIESVSRYHAIAKRKPSGGREVHGLVFLTIALLHGNAYGERNRENPKQQAGSSDQHRHFHFHSLSDKWIGSSTERQTVLESAHIYTSRRRK